MFFFQHGLKNIVKFWWYHDLGGQIFSIIFIYQQLITAILMIIAGTMDPGIIPSKVWDDALPPKYKGINVNNLKIQK